MTTRAPDGTVQLAESIYPIHPKVDMGGSNLYSSGTDFVKLLSSLLRNDGIVLRPQTTDLMFDYRLPKNRGISTVPDKFQDNFGGLAPVGMDDVRPSQ